MMATAQVILATFIQFTEKKGFEKQKQKKPCNLSRKECI